jgi:hypothetical protein
MAFTFNSNVYRSTGQASLSIVRPAPPMTLFDSENIFHSDPFRLLNHHF